MAISRPPVEITQTISYFKGLKISVNNTQIDSENSPDMLNLTPDDRGALDKRPGKINIFPSLGEGKIKGILTYHKSTGDIHVFAYGNKLYKITDLDEGTYQQVYYGIQGDRVRGFNYNNLLYFHDGNKLYTYDGSAVSEVEGKIPIITISTPPSGGGVLFESLNYIQSGFTQLFSGNGLDKEYQLAFDDLDDTEVIAEIDGVTQTEGVDFTVDRETGIVTWNTEPPETTPDNVSITAFKTFEGNKDEIFKCTISYIWGGTDGDRVWLTGNPDYVNRDYVSGLHDPTYWPVTGFDDLGGTNDPIKGYSELYGALLIIKRKSIYMRTSEEIDGEIYFKTKRLNGAIGAESTDSICIIDSFPTFVSRKGVYQVISIDTSNENNVRHISDDIDKNVNILSIQGLLDMGNLSDYVGIDYDSKYLLFNPNNGTVWVYAYRYIVDGQGQWFKLDNLYTSCALEIGNNLYMGCSKTGTIWRFLTKEDSDQLSDIEVKEYETEKTAIHAYWTSKITHYNILTNLKLVAKVFFDLKPSRRSSAKLYIRTNGNSVWKFVKEVFVSLFTYSLLQYSRFTYSGSEFPKQTKQKVKQKGIGYMQVKIENNEVSESLGLINVSTKLMVQKEVD